MPTTDDYTKYRATGVIPYEIDDIIGRHDSVDKTQITSMTVSGGVPVLVPSNPLGRRNFISIKNTGAVDVALLTSSGASVSGGYIISASGGEFTDNTDATFYIVSTGAASTVKVYERSARFNYR